MFFVVPFFPQPRLANIYLRFAVGIPLTILGMAFRFSPPVYFWKMKTRPSKWVLAAHGPAYFITSGPYSIVRQPQYVGSIIFIIGWYLIWGGLYTLSILPVSIIYMLLWTLIEEKYILEKAFGDEYREYKKNVGMFLPKIGGKSRLNIQWFG
ncbi:MAG: isoprenylcysteine carboxylmethyltransferase family protein [Candidatus Bathyarchaeia archaeon]|nr:isoprenylcysteine carboxylmethyltransferase family protein [Candidatus Bathyarchaeia archaeon]